MVISKKILLVDDEAGIRSLLFEALSEKGFEVTLAKDGKDSLDQMKNDHFDLLITDMHMPRLDGVGLLKEMKKSGRKEKVIIMTGRPEDVTLRKKDVPPVLTQLHKPFQIGSLLDVVSSALAEPAKKRRKKKAVSA